MSIREIALVGSSIACLLFAVFLVWFALRTGIYTKTKQRIKIDTELGYRHPVMFEVSTTIAAVIVPIGLICFAIWLSWSVVFV